MCLVGLVDARHGGALIGLLLGTHKTPFDGDWYTNEATRQAICISNQVSMEIDMHFGSFFNIDSKR
ncbi:hypothetical protein MUK42_33323 [Musa troglodytarum]|uniref:Uncharacterized protein n=1 Tax=Musa troglodytarum TaxID=320322 RepID=A0A9E7JUA0_9LILI|nr:hypothetical protein MUK42_33323 [Musa troglodytarum]